MFLLHTSTSPSECGGVYKVRSATFTSPQYPQNYASNLFCEWFLEVEDNHRLSLRFVDFSLESEETCLHDSIEVWLLECFFFSFASIESKNKVETEQ